jgi:hypothetical protein
LVPRDRLTDTKITVIGVGTIDHVGHDHFMITATHTHSGPSTVKYLSNEADSAVPDPDPKYLRRLEDGIVAAAQAAHSAAAPAKLGLGAADGAVVGGNRRDPAGPSNPRIPVLVARAIDGGEPIAAMLVCSMHPTVLHEDSTLVSGDFSGLARRHLQATTLGNCPVLWHTGPCGNQSPRHVTRVNTFAEAAAEQGYEASNGLFCSPQSGELLVRKTLELLENSFPKKPLTVR